MLAEEPATDHFSLTHIFFSSDGPYGHFLLEFKQFCTILYINSNMTHTVSVYPKKLSKGTLSKSDIEHISFI